MNLEKRIEQLEQRIRPDDEPILFLIRALAGCDPEKLGPDRVIHREVTGYGTAGGGRAWTREPGESVEHLKARMEADVRGEGHKVYAVCERYE